MALFLVILPLMAAILAYVLRSDAWRVRLLPITATLHFVGVLAALRGWGTRPPNLWLGLDALGGWVLLVVSGLFAICAFYPTATTGSSSYASWASWAWLPF
jgi:hydrogenase-4 component F